MRSSSLVILLTGTLIAAACGDDGGSVILDAGVPDAEPALTFEECSDSDQAFVRNAHLALLGTRAKSQAQVNVYTDLMSAIRARNATPQDVDAGTAPPQIDPREAIAEILVQDSRFLDRWSEHVMDALQVPRIEDQSQQSCYGTSDRGIAGGDDGGSLAAFVRDNDPNAGGDGSGQFTMRDLLRSSLVLDDLSPVYRAHLFALVSRPIPAANVPRVQAELARREDFGNVFDAAFLNRDLTCMVCHNGESSVTASEDPALNRHWDLPGYFETAIYGAAVGIEPDRAHAPFRYDGFVGNGGSRPWQWDDSCGEFYPDGLSADPADIDGLFASLAGNTTTVYDLERALRDGFESIASNGLVLEADESIADPDAAFAYLVAANLVDGVWAEVIGARLTIANHFPRNKESRDLLHQLTESFVASQFSLKTLLIEILKTPYFNRLEPAAGCGSTPYNIPPVFDPWSISAEEPEEKNNSVGDALAPLSARTLLSAGYAALDWRRPFFESFPEQPGSINNCAQAFPSCPQLANACQNNDQCCYAEEYWCQFDASDNEPSTRSQRAFLRGVGVFLKNGNRGFRGLDFQARLVFEDRFAACRKIDLEDDFIDSLQELATTTPGASLGDVVAAIKDRLIGQARVEHAVGASGLSEKQSLESYFGVSLDADYSDIANADAKLRGYCGLLLSTPQFLLSGLAAPDGRYEAILTPEAYQYEATCTGLELPATLVNLTLQCSSTGLELR